MDQSFATNETIGDRQDRLCVMHWHPTCIGCESSQDCSLKACPCISRQPLRYYIYCKAEVDRYLRAVDGENKAKRLECLAQVISLLSSQPNLTKEKIKALAFTNWPTKATQQEKDVIIHLAVKTLFMTDCSAIDYFGERLETGTCRVTWQDNVSWSKFVEGFFPIMQHPTLSYPDSTEYPTFRSRLKATNLKKLLGIIIRATDDIRNHLKYDPGNNVLYVFHHTCFLKEQLKRTKDLSKDCVIQDALNRAALPRQLVLEVLESLQGVLFPLSDKRSRKLLKLLVRDRGFDLDILRFEFHSIKKKGEENISFCYLANRLSELQSELENPRPRGWLERQLERRSGARYMMMATMFGVLFAVLLGILSLAVSSYQTYIAYQAWKHPVPAG